MALWNKYGGFLKWGYPCSSSSILDWHFPWNKPSSYWGTTMTMETLIYHPQWQDFCLTGPLSAGLPGRELLGKWKGRDQSILENAASVLKHAKAFPNGDFHRGIPNNWLVYFMENPNRKWMMNRGTPISGNLQMYESKPWYPRYPITDGSWMFIPPVIWES